MPQWIEYLFKFNLSLSLVWLFYQVFLRRLTFYNWNRIYLLAYTAICFLIPFVNINPWLNSSGMAGISLVHNMPTVSHFVVGQGTTAAVEDSRFGYPFLLGMILLAGSMVMGIRLLIMYISLLRISHKAKLLVDEPVQIFETRQDVIPFSFGKKIFIHPASLPGQDLETIIRHEFIHVKQRHSFDILFSEFVCIVAWYNPFAWLIRHAIRQNLEFIADKMVINNGTDKKAYQYLLLKVTGFAPISITNNFNLSSLKNRMVMMNKTKSERKQLLKFLMCLPLVFVLLMAFRNAGENILPGLLHKDLSISSKDTVPPPPPPPGKLFKVVPDKPVAPKIATAIQPKAGPMLKNVKNINIKDNLRATVELKNGKKEYYNLNNAEESKSFQKKYGSLAEPPEPIIEADIADPVEDEPMAPVVAEAAPSITTTVNVKAATPSVATTSGPAKVAVGAAPVMMIDDEAIEVDGDILLNLNAKSTEADIDKQVAQLKTKGYTIDITNKVWVAGKLSLIEGTISGKKKKTAHFKAADFKELYFSTSDDDDSETGIQFYVVKGRLSIN